LLTLLEFPDLGWMSSAIIIIYPPSLVNLSAFDYKLISTCLILFSSDSIIIFISETGISTFSPIPVPASAVSYLIEFLAGKPMKLVLILIFLEFAWYC